MPAETEKDIGYGVDEKPSHDIYGDQSRQTAFDQCLKFDKAHSEVLYSAQEGRSAYYKQ